MSNDLVTILKQIIGTTQGHKTVKQRFLQRLKKGSPTKEENQKSHYCVFFLPYNSKTKRIFLVHHKKADKWISPGGHIEKGELPTNTLIRELQEELGYVLNKQDIPKPFLLTRIRINNSFPCKEHFDIWYAVETPTDAFVIDHSEFYDTRWVSIEEAEGLSRDRNNLTALKIFEENQS